MLKNSNAEVMKFKFKKSKVFRLVTLNNFIS